MKQKQAGFTQVQDLDLSPKNHIVQVKDGSSYICNCNQPESHGENK